MKTKAKTKLGEPARGWEAPPPHRSLLPRFGVRASAFGLRTRHSALGSARKFAKTRFGRFPKFIYSTPKKNRESFGSKNLLFANFARFWTRHGQTDVTISSRIKFCFRCTFFEVCTTKIPSRHVLYRPPAHVLRGNHHMSSVGTTTCALSKPAHVLRGNHHMSSLGTRKFRDWNTRNLVIGT